LRSRKYRWENVIKKWERLIEELVEGKIHDKRQKNE